MVETDCQAQEPSMRRHPAVRTTVIATAASLLAVGSADAAESPSAYDRTVLRALLEPTLGRATARAEAVGRDIARRALAEQPPLHGPRPTNGVRLAGACQGQEQRF